MAAGRVKPRSIVYVDGFNLYYGALRGGPNLWLNLQRYFEMLRPADDLQVVRYYTALVNGPAGVRQSAYLQALETLPKVEVVHGRFKSKTLHCLVQACQHVAVRTFATQEEKRTDVNIAIGMLDDAYQNLCDKMIVVSGDSDLVPAIHMVKRRFPTISIHVYIPATHPTRGAATEMRYASDHHKTLPRTYSRSHSFRRHFRTGQADK